MSQGGMCSNCTPSRTNRVCLEILEPRRLLAASLVKDINPISLGAGTTNALDMGSYALFSATDGLIGYDLWRTDGTEAGTRLVTEIRPGTNNAAISNLTRFNTVALFSADDGTHGVELWRSDGTASGTYMVKDIRSGASGGIYSSFVLLGSNAWFFGYDGSYGLWKTDGTDAGTTLVHRFTSTELSTSASPTSLSVAGGRLYFVLQEPGTGYTPRLWTSDGTDAGTSRVTSRCYTSEAVFDFNGIAYFAAGDSTTFASSIWRSDGTDANTYSLGNITPLYGQRFAAWNNQLYFLGSTASTTTLLWRTDGTVANTIAVPQSVILPDLGAGDLRIFGNYAYFIGNYQYTSKHLWRFDLINQTVSSVFAASGFSLPAVVGSNLYFISASNLYSITDPAGTPALVRSCYSTTVWPLGQKALFLSSVPNSATELHITDGTTGGTSLVKDINTITATSDPQSFVTDGKVAYFIANDGNGKEIWRTDGTRLGTWMLADTHTKSSGIEPRDLALTGGKLYATFGSSRNELWVSDGTTAGTRQIIGSFAGISQIGQMTWLDGMLYFRATTSAGGAELWKTDGTQAGTVMVADLNPGTSSSSPQWLTVLNGSLFFFAADGVHGSELYRLDPGGLPWMLLDIFPGSSSGSSYYRPIVFNNIMLFDATDTGMNDELWRTDGTPEGTWQLADINPDFYSGVPMASYPQRYFVWNNKVFFDAADGTIGHEPRCTDGITVWTLADIYPGTGFGDPIWFGGNSKYLFFSGYSATTGAELWRTDGTPAGTTLVQEIYPGSTNGTSARFVAIANDLLYFSGTDPANGTELWQSDGTSAGTVLVQDLWPGANSSDPLGYMAVNGNLIFSAASETMGRELYFYGIDKIAPTSAGPQFDHAGVQALRLSFSEPAGDSLEPADLQLVNLSTGLTIPAGNIALDYDTITNLATFTFPGYGDGVLPNGNYRARIAAASVNDAAGNALPADVALDFFVLAADATRDRKVDFDDLLILAQNYNGSGRTWATGDFTGDGLVDFDDLLLLAQNYNVTVAAVAVADEGVATVPMAEPEAVAVAGASGGDAAGTVIEEAGAATAVGRVAEEAAAANGDADAGLMPGAEADAAVNEAVRAAGAFSETRVRLRRAHRAASGMVWKPRAAGAVEAATVVEPVGQGEALRRSQAPVAPGRALWPVSWRYDGEPWVGAWTDGGVLGERRAASWE